MVGNIPTRAEELSMPNVEKISIALPPEMVAVIRQAVETGEYASSTEAVRDALREWTQKRSLRQRASTSCARCGGKRWKTKRPGFRSMRYWTGSNASAKSLPMRANNAASPGLCLFFHICDCPSRQL